MNEWLNGHAEASPFKRAETEMVSVDIRTVLPQSPDTWQVDWVETTRDRQGSVKGPPVTMRALVTVYTAEVSSQTTDEQLRNPLNIIPPEFRPRVALRFADQNELLVSGLLQGGGDIAQRPVVVDVPVDKGHVVLFANNPIWRGETIGSYFLVFNTLLNFDNLNAGRKLDAK